MLEQNSGIDMRSHFLVKILQMNFQDFMRCRMLNARDSKARICTNFIAFEQSLSLGGAEARMAMPIRPGGFRKAVFISFGNGGQRQRLMSSIVDSYIVPLEIASPAWRCFVRHVHKACDQYSGSLRCITVIIRWIVE